MKTQSTLKLEDISDNLVFFDPKSNSHCKLTAEEMKNVIKEIRELGLEDIVVEVGSRE